MTTHLRLGQGREGGTYDVVPSTPASLLYPSNFIMIEFLVLIFEGTWSIRPRGRFYDDDNVGANV